MKTPPTPGHIACQCTCLNTVPPKQSAKDVLPPLDAAGAICAKVRLCLHLAGADAGDCAVPTLLPAGETTMSALHYHFHHSHCGALLQWHCTVHIL